MTNTLHIKYKNDQGVVCFIKPWSNYVNAQGPDAQGVVQPASGRILHDKWGAKFTVDEHSTKDYIDYCLIFNTKEQLTYWLLRWS